MKIFILLAFILLTGVSIAGDRYPFSHPDEAKRFNQLISQFRCLVCQNEDLASSDAPLANDLRNTIYQQVKMGETNERIIHYMVNRYGDFVLFKPPFSGKTYVLWLGPFLLLFFGFFIWFVVIRKYVARR